MLFITFAALTTSGFTNITVFMTLIATPSTILIAANVFMKRSAKTENKRKE